MRAGQLPIDEQLERFRAALTSNRTLTEVLARAATMGLPGLVPGRRVPVSDRVERGHRPAARGGHPRLRPRLLRWLGPVLGCRGRGHPGRSEDLRGTARPGADPQPGTRPPVV